MSRTGWSWPLADNETLLWQGRPAPRCYTFRRWKAALAGSLLFLASSLWLFLGYQLVAGDGHSQLLLAIPLPLVVISFFFGPGQLLLARWRWEKLFYAVTDRRLLVRDGLLWARFCSIPLNELTGWQQRSYGTNLASIRLLRGEQPPQVLACLEYPQLLIDQLPGRVQQVGNRPDPV